MKKPQTFPTWFSHEGNPAMQTPADNLAFLKDAAPLSRWQCGGSVMSCAAGWLSAVFTTAPQEAACGDLTCEFTSASRQRPYREGPCTESFCENEKRSHLINRTR